MRLCGLEVQDFRGIREAKVTFGPGVTVLHGPNELGKSTLIDAIRAALFLQTSASAGEGHVTWGGSMPACVTLTFEHSGKLWRVEKRFGFRRQAKLACSDSVENPRYRDVAEGNNVEGRLRELLAWGIAPPGGKGAGPKLGSFLLTALLGRQGEVQGIFDASLDEDRDDTGKAMVTRALGALDKDPVVTTIVERLAARVDQVFTSKDRRPKTSADSPLVVLQQAFKRREDELSALREADRQGQEIRRNVVRLQDERQRLLAEVEAAASEWEAAKAQRERATVRAKLQAEIDDMRRQLDDVDRLTTELDAREGELNAATSRLATLKDAENAEGVVLEATRQSLQTAAEAVARETEAVAQSGKVFDETRARRRAELDARKTSLESRLKDVAAAEQAVCDAADLERQSADASAVSVSAVDAVEQAEGTLEHAAVRARLAVLNERSEAMTRAAAQLADAQQREQAARDGLGTAKAALVDAESRRDGREAESKAIAIREAELELTLLHAVDVHIGLTALRAEVHSLGEAAVQAQTRRAEANANRTQASDLEQRVAGRELPTPERIAAWRVLEQAINASPLPASTKPASPLLPIIAGLVCGLVAAAGAHLALGLSVATTLLGGIVFTALASGLVWVALRSRNRQAHAEHEEYPRRRERWTQEVEPSLRSARLPGLAAYEDAVGELAKLRADAQRLRAEADQLDLAAVEAERTAAALETRRETLTRLERETPVADATALSARMERFGGDVEAVQRQVAAVQENLDDTRARLREAADTLVHAAVAQRDARQAEYDATARGTSAADTTLRLARQEANPEAITRLQARLAEIGGVASPAASVDEATAALDAAKTRQATAAAKADSLRARLDEARAAFNRLVTTLGGDLEGARRQAEQALDAIATELAALETAPAAAAAVAATALEHAHNEHDRFERLLADENTALDETRAARADADRAATDLRTDVAGRRGQLNAINRVELESRLQEATGDSVFAVLDDAQLDRDIAHDRLERVRRQLERCTTDLNQATGQLRLIAGHVGSERLAQQEDAVAHARAEILERELSERAALRLLREIEAVEEGRTTHLGRALAGPVSQSFKALTGERYGPVAFSPALRTEHVEADGESRKLEALSVGTREQLATLLRLAIAGQLQTTVVLDDQLVHSDPARLAWFRDRLRQSVRDFEHQAIVFTCRPQDYLSEDEFAGTGAPELCVIDLAAVVNR